MLPDRVVAAFATLLSIVDRVTGLEIARVDLGSDSNSWWGHR
ncbi:MAG: hypothetical protein R2991_06160 [Thermoanaerobaculia bacterium]